MTMTTQNGDTYSGIMSSSILTNNDQSFTLKMVQQQMQADVASNGDSASQSFVGSAPDHAMTFDIRDLADLVIPSLTLAEAKPVQNGSFTTVL